MPKNSESINSQSPVGAREEAGEKQSRNDNARSRRDITLRLDTPPVGIERLRRSSDPRLSSAANAFAEKLSWPGKDGKPLPVKRKLTAAQQELYELGRIEYNAICAGCHHPSGYGLPAKGPQLLGSRWLDNEQWLTRVVLHGVQGAIEVHGETYNSEGRLSMPGMRASLDDKKIAGILTFIRRDFVDDASPIDPAQVSDMRRDYADRTEPWTESELKDVEP